MEDLYSFAIKKLLNFFSKIIQQSSYIITKNASTLHSYAEIYSLFVRLAPKVRSQFFEIVKGFGMLPDKEIVDFVLRGTSVHCLPSMIYHLRQKCDVGPFMPCLPSMKNYFFNSLEM